MSKGRTNYFWISLFFIHLCFLAWQIQHEQWLLVDSHDYIWAAKNLENSGTLYCANMDDLPIYQGNFTRRPPFYPFFLSISRSLSTSFLLPAIFQLGCSLLGFFLFLQIFSFLYPGKIPPKYLLFFLCLYPAQYIYANLIMAESLFQLLLMVSIYFLFRGIAHTSIKAYIWHSIFLVFAVLTKPVLYLIIPIHLLFFIYYAWKNKKSGYLIVGLIPVLVMAVYVQRNYQKTNYVHVSSVQNINLFQFPVTYILARNHEAEEADRIVDDILTEARSLGSFRAEQEYLSKKNTEVLKKYPGTFVQLHLRGMVNFFLDPGRFDLYHFFSIENDTGQGLMATFGKDGYRGVLDYVKQQPLLILFLLGIVLLLNLVKFIAFLIFPFSSSIKLAHRLIIGLIILYIAGVTGTMGASRFAMPCFYLMLLTLPAAVGKLKTVYLRIRSQ